MFRRARERVDMNKIEWKRVKMSENAPKTAKIGRFFEKTAWCGCIKCWLDRVDGGMRKTSAQTRKTVGYSRKNRKNRQKTPKNGWGLLLTVGKVREGLKTSKRDWERLKMVENASGHVIELENEWKNSKMVGRSWECVQELEMEVETRSQRCRHVVVSTNEW